MWWFHHWDTILHNHRKQKLFTGIKYRNFMKKWGYKVLRYSLPERSNTYLAQSVPLMSATKALFYPSQPKRVVDRNLACSFGESWQYLINRSSNSTWPNASSTFIKIARRLSRKQRARVYLLSKVNKVPYGQHWTHTLEAKCSYV